WTYGFWSEPHPGEDEPPLPMNYIPPRRLGGLLPVAGLVGIALAIGLGAGFFFGIAQVAARGIIRPAGYVQAVLGPAAMMEQPSVPQVSPAVASVDDTVVNGGLP